MPEHQNIKQSKGTQSSQRQIIPARKIHVTNPAAIIQRARIDPKSITSADVLQLQRTIGNRAVGRLLSEIRNTSKVQQVPIQRQTLKEEETCPSCMQRQEIPEDEPLQTKSENNTGMPDTLKAGVESLSGIDMSDVRVHYNSSKPAEVGALAYTQGTDIHVAPGQKRHLPHEAWHVVQQKQERVQPMMQMKGFEVNDNEGLEREADLMGKKAFENTTQLHRALEEKTLLQCKFAPVQRAERKPKLKMPGPEDKQPETQVGGASLTWQPMIGIELIRYAEHQEVTKEGGKLTYTGRTDNKAVWFVDPRSRYDPSMAQTRPYLVKLSSEWTVPDESTVWINQQAMIFKGEAKHLDQVIVKENERGAYGIGKNLIHGLLGKITVMEQKQARTKKKK